MSFIWNHIETSPEEGQDVQRVPDDGKRGIAAEGDQAVRRLGEVGNNEKRWTKRSSEALRMRLKGKQ